MREYTELSVDGVLVRGAALALLAALILAWSLVGLGFGVEFVHAIFPGKFIRVLQAHLDFLLMAALILGLQATRLRLPGIVRWAMVIGAFTNSSLFLLQAVFPALDGGSTPPGIWGTIYLGYVFASITVTSFGFGRAAAIALRLGGRGT
jgi:hypothetical protein